MAAVARVSGQCPDFRPAEYTASLSSGPSAKWWCWAGGAGGVLGIVGRGEHDVVVVMVLSVVVASVLEPSIGGEGEKVADGDSRGLGEVTDGEENNMTHRQAEHLPSLQHTSPIPARVSCSAARRGRGGRKEAWDDAKVWAIDGGHEGSQGHGEAVSFEPRLSQVQLQRESTRHGVRPQSVPDGLKGPERDARRVGHHPRIARKEGKIPVHSSHDTIAPTLALPLRAPRRCQRHPEPTNHDDDDVLTSNHNLTGAQLALHPGAQLRTPIIGVVRHGGITLVVWQSLRELCLVTALMPGTLVASRFQPSEFQKYQELEPTSSARSTTTRTTKLTNDDRPQRPTAPGTYRLREVCHLLPSSPLHSGFSQGLLHSTVTTQAVRQTKNVPRHSTMTVTRSVTAVVNDEHRLAVVREEAEHLASSTALSSRPGMPGTSNDAKGHLPSTEGMLEGVEEDGAVKAGDEAMKEGRQGGCIYGRQAYGIFRMRAVSVMPFFIGEIIGRRSLVEYNIQ
ncbi:hypothetical protein DFP72DRAFT_856760 [Ephemerocybe angulata]|uniref:Uncharacterized protein n=1 Tax=Ephemerocybe angulata TaxID=980116 RepID=A0A8H6HG95_9AGAR|nr:hypothetical protein DFP72DRAFT_856760 [Tulosesus angulatus]